MKRRTFLKSLSAAPVIAYLPQMTWAQPSSSQKTLVLVQLGGGNDSLNTFVPTGDSAYFAARNTLAISADDALPLTNTLALNPVMENLLPSWNSGDMAIVQGLGYAMPNRSHFRSLDIWQTASDTDEVLTMGWAAELLPLQDQPLDAVVISGSPGALLGEPELFTLGGGDISQQSDVYVPEGSGATGAVSYVLEQRHLYNDSVQILQQALASPSDISTPFPSDNFGRQCETVATLLGAGVQPAVLHLSLGSFDTHSNQRQQHDTLLRQLANGLAALREELIALGLWSQVTIATYAEFGRRVAENASAGTDHGTAASHLVMGGAVSGGLWGEMPSLTDLDEGDMIFNQDFRSYYRTFSDWMGWSPSAQISDFSNIGFL